MFLALIILTKIFTLFRFSIPKFIHFHDQGRNQEGPRWPGPLTEFFPHYSFQYILRVGISLRNTNTQNIFYYSFILSCLIYVAVKLHDFKLLLT